MSSSENIPSEFSDLKVTFVSDGAILKVCHVKYGDAVDALPLPAIPDREVNSRKSCK